MCICLGLEYLRICMKQAKYIHFSTQNQRKKKLEVNIFIEEKGKTHLCFVIYVHVWSLGTWTHILANRARNS